MKLTKKILCFILSAAMMSISVGCTKDTSTEGEQITKLKMILTGDKPTQYDDIYGKLNEMLKKDIGAEVEVEYYNYSDLNQKYSLLFSTGENFDIVFAANWVNYNQQAAKNSFMEITDEMLKKNAPKTYETLTKSAKNEAKVNGKMYMIPNTAAEYDTNVALIRGDLREKYGMEPIETLDDFETYLENVAKNDKSIIPLVNLVAVGSFWGGYKNKVSRIEIPKGTEILYDVLENKFEKKDFQPYYRDQVKKTREFVDKGIIPADIVANKTIDNMFENGKAATYVKNLETCSSMAKKLRGSHPEWKVEICDFSQGVPKIVNPSISNGLALNRTTKNADKALQFIELLRNDKRYFDLTWYGIEGKHWNADGDNGYVSLNSDLPKEERYEPGCVWGWKNQAMLRVDKTDIPEKQEILNRWKQETIESDIYGFIFDDTNVKTELASISSVASQYGGPLYNGMIEQSKLDSSFKTYEEKLTQAGIDKVYEETLKQYEQYQKTLK